MSIYSNNLAPANKASALANRIKTFESLAGFVSLQVDVTTHQGQSAIVDRKDLRTAVLALRDKLGFDMLVDIVGIDYLNMTGYQGPRFAVAYIFKSLHLAGQRFQLKVLVSEEDAVIPSIHDLYAIADWQERETWDLIGVVFEGHPNLKRLLNHFEFVGHPLRKDYPAQKRQWLSMNDPMLDQLSDRLRQKGFELLDPVPVNTPAVEDIIKGSRQ